MEYKLLFYKSLANGRLFEIETLFFTVKPLAVLRVERTDELTGEVKYSKAIKKGEDKAYVDMLKSWLYKHDDRPMLQKVTGGESTSKRMLKLLDENDGGTAIIWHMNERQFSAEDMQEIRRSWLMNDI